MIQRAKKGILLFSCLSLLGVLSTIAQTFSGTAKITGVVKDPTQAVLAGVKVILTNVQSKVKVKAVTDNQGAYAFPSLPAGTYTVEVDAKGFNPSTSGELKVAEGHAVNSDFALALAGTTQSVTVSAGSFENAYRVDNLTPGSPFGPTPIVNLPYTINVISRQLIDDTMARNFKEAAKYLPLVSFQEMQGPEILRPETRGMQGTNMQGDRMDGMGFAVTVPFALEEYEQIEVLSGVGGSMYGPSNPSGTFNFVTKTPTEEPLREAEVEYEGRSVVTGHAGSGRTPGAEQDFWLSHQRAAGRWHRLRDQQPASPPIGRLAISISAPSRIRRLAETTATTTSTSMDTPAGSPTIRPSIQQLLALLPTTQGVFPNCRCNAPDPAREGYGQRFLGSNTNNQIGEVRAMHDFSPNWHLNLGVLQQISVRNLTTPVNALYDSTGDYQSEAENLFQGTISGRFQVKSDLGYLTGNFKTWGIDHEVVIGSTGYKFSTWGPKNSLRLAAFLCELDASTVCHTNINNPLIDANPGYTPYTGKYSLYVTSIIHQQGFNFGDTIALTPAVDAASGRQPGLDLDEQLQAERYIS